MTGVPRIFNSDVLMALEFLKGRGVVAESSWDSTERLLGRLKAQSVGRGLLAICCAEFDSNVQMRSVITLYAQKQLPTSRGTRLVQVGAYCLNCGYQRIDVWEAGRLMVESSG